MKTTDLRAKARAIFGPAFAEPMPNQPNGAKALQQRANARPIPTYKVGGVVKKPTPPGPTAAEREEARRQNESLRKAKVTKKEGQVIESANRSEGGMYKKGGAAKKDGLAVMIAIGKAKPVKKAIGGRMRSALSSMKIKSAMDKAAAGLSAASASMPPRGSGTMNKVMNNPKMRAELEAAAAKAGVPVPVKRAAGGVAPPPPSSSLQASYAAMNRPSSKPATNTAPAAQPNSAKYQEAVSRAMLSPQERGLMRMVDKQKASAATAREMKDMKRPVKRAVGGAGKTRKGMMK